MTWTAVITLDDSADGVRGNIGEASASFTEPDGSVFTYSRRVNFTAAEKTAFVSESQAGLAAWRTEQIKLDGFEEALATALNA